MKIRLSKEAEQQSIESIKRYFAENLEEEIGDLKASLLLDFFLTEVGPSVYNKAVADVQVLLHDKITDLDGSCFRPEFGYWKT